MNKCITRLCPFLHSTEISFDEASSFGTDAVNSLSVTTYNLTTNNSLYTIVLYFIGQQASGIQSLIDLQCGASNLGLPMVLLEPMVIDNTFQAMPLVHRDDSGNSIQNEHSMLFSDLFDVSLFNKMSSNWSYPQLIPRDYFFKTAPRRIVFVVLYEEAESTVPEMKPVWPELPDAPADGCFDPMTSHPPISKWKSQIHQLTKLGFCVVKVVQFRIGHIAPIVFTEDQLRNSVLGGDSYSNVTLVINTWMPKYVMPGLNHKECVYLGYRSAKRQIQPSKRLLADVKYYEDHFLKSSGKRLALMIRLEHVFNYLRRQQHMGQWSVETCLNVSTNMAKNLTESKSLGKPFVTLDIGRYGSRTLRSGGRYAQFVSKVLSSLYDGEWNLREWEDSFTQATGGVEDGSYIAALQRTLASKSECLILVGGGMFQELTMKKYMETHDKAEWCIRLYCIKDRRGYAI